MSNLLTRDDTLLGVCEGVGEEFGFHPNYLRIVLATMLLWNPLVVIGGYLALGLVVAAVRCLVPGRSVVAPDPAAEVAADNDAAEPPLPLAA